MVLVVVQISVLRRRLRFIFRSADRRRLSIWILSAETPTNVGLPTRHIAAHKMTSTRLGSPMPPSGSRYGTSKRRTAWLMPCCGSEMSRVLLASPSLNSITQPLSSASERSTVNPSPGRA